MCLHVFQHLLLGAAGLTVARGTSGAPYALVADAGSTGTRMYLFHVIEDGKSEGRIDIADLGKGPALSSFVDSPSDAAGAVKKQIDKAKGMIPEGLHSSVQVRVFATAGMRLLTDVKAAPVYAGLRQGLLDDSFPFDKESFQARTISGREEGVFAFVAANYLSHRISSDLQVLSTNLMGVLDLGGSSTQIAVPPTLGEGEHLAGRLGERDTHVRSFLSYGMERMRQLTYRHIVNSSHWVQRMNSAAANPCAFIGFKDEEQSLWRGTGDSVGCEKAIAAVLKAETRACKGTAQRGKKHKHRHGAQGKHDDSDCLPMRMTKNAAHIANTGTPRFFLISGFVFVTDFARWWLERSGALPRPAEFGQWWLEHRDLPNQSAQTLQRLADGRTYVTPSLYELRAAAALLCSESWENISAAANASSGRHRMTPSHKVPHRCFELNYIITLLSLGYGFDESARPFQVVDKLEGSDVEWSLGAFLLSRSLHSVESSGGNFEVEGESIERLSDHVPHPLFSPGWHFPAFFFAIGIAMTVLCFMRGRCAASDGPGYGEKIA